MTEPVTMELILRRRAERDVDRAAALENLRHFYANRGEHRNARHCLAQRDCALLMAQMADANAEQYAV